MNKKRIFAYSFVVAQMLILFALIFLSNNLFSRFQPQTSLGYVLKVLGAVGLLASAGSLRGALTAVPIPKESGTLSTGGLYKYVRHPMYTALLLFSAGMALGSGSVLKCGFFFALLAVLYFKSRFEEKFLLVKYANYKEYLDRTPRFLPNFR